MKSCNACGQRLHPKAAIKIVAENRRVTFFFCSKKCKRRCKPEKAQTRPLFCDVHLPPGVPIEVLESPKDGHSTYQHRPLPAKEKKK